MKLVDDLVIVLAVARMRPSALFTNVSLIMKSEETERNDPIDPVWLPMVKLAPIFVAWKPGRGMEPTSPISTRVESTEEMPSVPEPLELQIWVKSEIWYVTAPVLAFKVPTNCIWSPGESGSEMDPCSPANS